MKYNAYGPDWVVPITSIMAVGYTPIIWIEVKVREFVRT